MILTYIYFIMILSYMILQTSILYSHSNLFTIIIINHHPIIHHLSSLSHHHILQLLQIQALIIYSVLYINHH